MDDIQYLPNGERIVLAGGIRATVEDNPRDGVWLLARYSRNEPLEKLGEGIGRGAHGMTRLQADDPAEVVVVAHADDIVERDRAQPE